MSMKQSLNVTCPECGKESVCTAWPSVNEQLDPEVKKELLTGELTMFTCSFCGTRRRLCYPLLYHDMKTCCMVHLVFDGSTHENDEQHDMFLRMAQKDHYRFRIVDSFNELQEKIRIFDAGLDDRIVEIFKSYMRHHDKKGQYPEECWTGFAGFTDGKKGKEIAIAVLSPGGCDYVRYSAKKYENVHANMTALVEIEQNVEGPHPLWRRINESYARQMLHYDK